MEDTPVEMSRNDRIEFVCGWIFVAVVATPVLYCWIGSWITGEKCSFASAAIVTGVAATATGVWASRAAPHRFVQTFIFVVVPLVFGIGMLILQVVDLVAKIAG